VGGPFIYRNFENGRPEINERTLGIVTGTYFSIRPKPRATIFQTSARIAREDH